MANTYTKLNLHIVFHVKSTSLCIRKEDLHQVFAYIGGIIQNVGGYPVTVGGITNHISPSLLKKTIHYIETQETHHQEESVLTEYKRFLNANNVEYDERYLL